MPNAFVTEIDGKSVEVTLTAFRGGHFTQFYATKVSYTGPGWYIMGRNPAYSGCYRMLVARPNVAPVKYQGFNGKIRRGWRTKAEAQRIADIMNQRDRDSLGMVASLGELHGTQFRDDTTEMPASLVEQEIAVSQAGAI